MSAAELWLAYVARNPRFADPKAEITFTQAGLKKFFDQTFEKGDQHGRKMAGAEKSLFDSIFGKAVK